MDRKTNLTPRHEATQHEPTEIAGGLVRVVLALVIIELTLATANIHFSLGGQLFTLNGFGYVALGAAYAIGALVPVTFVQRIAWLPRIGLLGYALTTIGAYLVIGPYFTMGWTAKGIEVAIIALLFADMVVVYGSPKDVWRAALGTFSSARPPSGPRHA
jgi:hypothetical protein